MLDAVLHTPPFRQGHSEFSVVVEVGFMVDVVVVVEVGFTVDVGLVVVSGNNNDLF